MRPRFKVWLEDEGGQAVFGEGIYELLTAVDRLGSINQAAKSLRMSYRQAWGHIRQTEARLGKQLLVRQVGGEAGGGAKLTTEGREMLARYHRLLQDVEEQVRDLFVKDFPGEG